MSWWAWSATVLGLIAGTLGAFYGIAAMLAERRDR